MKVAIPCSKDKKLVPLDEAEIIEIYDDSDGSIVDNDNDGYGNKEATMSMIMGMAPDAIAIKSGIMCPGSYMMSQGSIKYAVVKSDSAADIIKNKEYEEVSEELAPEIFAE